MRAIGLLALLFVHANAGALTCALLDTGAARTDLVAAFQRAEIVAYVDYLSTSSADVYEVSVVRAWKGEIGATGLVHGRGSGLVVAERVDDHPLRLMTSPASMDCTLLNIRLDKPSSDLQKLVWVWGEGSVPDGPRMETDPAAFQSVLIDFATVGVSALLLVLLGSAAMKFRR